MISLRQLFLAHVGQTSEAPLCIEIERAEGIYMYSPSGKRYTDLISGVSVSNVGHCNPHVVNAVCKQVNSYMHLMVYGEFIQNPQVKFAKALVDILPSSLSSVYFVNSGSEANEGALKLAKRYTGRKEIISFKNAYHGSTHGALSVMGNEYFTKAFQPLLPNIKHLDFNNLNDVNEISTSTACVIVEPFQGEAGAIKPENNFLHLLREQCDRVGALLIFDEVQTGFGRLGEYFAFQKYGVTPDIITLAKAMGGGLPLGAFISSKEIMDSLQSNPVLGHITTFGGHPVSCTAALAALEVIQNENLISQVEAKAYLFRDELSSVPIKEIRGDGLLMAVDLETPERFQKFLKTSYEKGIASDGFLFCPTAFRIAPPLTITNDQIKEVCEELRKIIANL